MSTVIPTDVSEKPLAVATKGVSLGQDAWRRLRHNRMAMVSLATIITIGLLAFLAPMLPLAPPDKHHTDLQYEPPTLTPLFTRTFNLDWKSIEETPGRLAQIRQTILATSHPDRRKMRREMENILLRPYREAGFPDVGLLSRWMIRVRYRWFGDWALGPIAGRDEFGRDVLARVFWARGSRSSSASWRR